MIEFLHEKTLLVTSNGLKSVYELKDDDLIVCINKYGSMEYYSPIIESSDERGMYYLIATDMGEMRLSANSPIYYSGNYRNRLLVHDVATTLAGQQIEIPTSPFKENYWGTGKPINDTMLYSVKHLNRSKVFREEWVKVPVWGSVGIEIMDNLLIYQYEKNKLKWYAKVNSKLDRKTYYIYAGEDFKKGLSYKLAAYSSSIETKRIIDLSMIFDRNGRMSRKTKIMVDECSLHVLLALAVKAGYVCYVSKLYENMDDIDYIEIKKGKTRKLNIMDAYLMQNERENRTIIIPDTYYGVLCVSDGICYIHAY